MRAHDRVCLGMWRCLLVSSAVMDQSFLLIKLLERGFMTRELFVEELSLDRQGDQRKPLHASVVFHVPQNNQYTKWHVLNSYSPILD